MQPGRCSLAEDNHFTSTPELQPQSLESVLQGCRVQRQTIMENPQGCALCQSLQEVCSSRAQYDKRAKHTHFTTSCLSIALALIGCCHFNFSETGALWQQEARTRARVAHVSMTSCSPKTTSGNDDGSKTGVPA